ncbi:palmitoyltransferase ZDHHC11-like isoform X1 [Engraulis encrasicolus]|uniref:palmitoyltransferase ZDHHC11-like isoform X1 n=1 Tax=Engraulis encrasicolus TaxID=184585 RepID=UPI002FD257C1
MTCSKGCCARQGKVGPAPSTGEQAPRKAQTRNGWTLPPTHYQLFTWMHYTYFLLVTMGVYIPLLPSFWSLVCYSLIGGDFFLHLVAYVVTTSIDCAHPDIRARGYKDALPRVEKGQGGGYVCYACNLEVDPDDDVKHCNTCNKCIILFDHHCRWLNTCVARRNYLPFFVTVLSGVILLLIIFVLVVFVFVVVYTDPDLLRTAPQYQGLERSRWLFFLPFWPVEGSRITLLVLSGFTVVFSANFLIRLANLLIFHIYLNCRNITTYDYILEDRAKTKQKKEEEERMKEEEERKREMKRKDREEKRLALMKALSDSVQKIRDRKSVETIFFQESSSTSLDTVVNIHEEQSAITMDTIPTTSLHTIDEEQSAITVDTIPTDAAVVAMDVP